MEASPTMRLVVFHNLTSGGSKREAYELTRLLVADGHLVDLYCPTTANTTFLPLNDVVANVYQYRLDLLPAISRRLPGLRKYVDLMNFGRNLQRLKKLAQQIAGDIDRRGYDFVFVHHDQIVQSPYLLRFLKTPSVYYCAEPMRQFYEPAILRNYSKPKTWGERWQRRWYRPANQVQDGITKRVDRKNVQYATLLLTNSFFSAENIYRAYGLRARVVYLGVDVDKFRPLDLPKGDYVISVGAVSPLKGYDFIIQAIGEVPQNHRPRLVIVGNTASQGETNFLNELAAKCGVELAFRVNVSEQELVELYNQALAFVYAPVLEPFGLTPLEAMACGTPVVAVKEGGVRESVVDGCTGYLVERVAKGFGQAVSDLLKDTSVQRQFGTNGRQLVLREWTWQAAAERFLGTLGMVM